MATSQSIIRRYDLDQLVSTSKLLDLHLDLYWHETYIAGNLRAQVVYTRETITALVSTTPELVTDVIFGRNNSGMGLSAILAELNGTRVPLCYHFHSSNGSDTTLSPAIPGSWNLESDS